MNKRTCLIAAALAAFFMLPLFGLTAYAVELDVPENAAVAEATPTPEENPVQEAASGIGDISIANAAPVTDYPETPPRPFTPSGTGTVVDTATDSDGKVFYTITTPDDHVFYLVIDKQRNTENVYFLNAVTIADLMALAEAPVPSQGAIATQPPPAATTVPPVEETRPPTEQPSGGNMGMFIFIGIVVVIGGVAGWYFKVYRPKQQGATGGDEYEPPVTDDGNEYPSDWGEEQGGDDDSAPWDDSENEDDE